MANKDLFKQAIAEAKSVREAAIANAKEALEESLTPHLKDMLAAKLQEMEDSKVEEEVVNEEEVEEGMHDKKKDEGMHDKEKDESVEETIEEAPAKEKEEMEEASKEEEMEEGAHEDEVEEGEHEEAKDEAEEAADDAEGEDEDGEEEEIEVKDMDVEDLKNLIKDIIAQEIGGEDEVEDMDAGDIDMPSDDGIEGPGDEEIDLDELLKELEETTAEAKSDVSEEEVTEEEVVSEDVKEEVEEVNETEKELNEALETIDTLKKELSEVNTLNSKLLYVNRIFKANNLSESQKVNVIAAFDKAETVKEVKLVYETVKGSISNKKANETTIKESKGLASKATGTTAKKPEVINEVSDTVRRMQKLAGII